MADQSETTTTIAALAAAAGITEDALLWRLAGVLTDRGDLDARKTDLMGALANERRKHIEQYEVEDALRENLSLPYQTEFVWQTDGSVIAVWITNPGEPNAA